MTVYTRRPARTLRDRVAASTAVTSEQTRRTNTNPRRSPLAPKGSDRTVERTGPQLTRSPTQLGTTYDSRPSHAWHPDRPLTCLAHYPNSTQTPQGRHSRAIGCHPTTCRRRPLHAVCAPPASGRRRSDVPRSSATQLWIHNSTPRAHVAASARPDTPNSSDETRLHWETSTGGPLYQCTPLLQTCKPML